MKKDRPALRFFLDWVIVCVGVLSSLFCLITAFDFPTPVVLWGLVPLLALVFCLLFHGKTGKYYALGILALLLLLFWLLHKELIESFRNLWGQLCGRYVLGYDQFRDLLPREETSPEAVAPALLYLAALESYLAALSIRLWRRSFPAALALLPGILPCYILMDTPPALLALLAAVFTLLTQVFSQSVRRRASGEENKAIVLAALLSAAILGLLLLIFPRESYKPPITWDDLSRQMERIGRAQNNRGNYNAGLSGNPDEVDLATLGALPNRPTPVLFARSSMEGYFYLRGSSYAEFDGTHWTRDTLENWDKRALFPYLGVSGGETLSIESVDPEPLLYSTYQLTALPGGGTVISDSYIENSGEALRYSMLWLPNPGVVSPDPAYEQWVLEHCLELPEQTREGVLAWWMKNGGDSTPISAADGTPVTFSGEDGQFTINSFSFSVSDGITYMQSDSLERFAQSVADRVAHSAAYSRNPLRMPDDADFCTWFLNEADEGYCVHFASSCTALLRALGIPARYTAGYVCSLQADTRTAVTNLQAHAWVEAWIGGRWVVIEPTPDDATEFTGRVVTDETRPVDDPEMTDRPEITEREILTDTMPPWELETQRATRPSRDEAERNTDSTELSTERPVKPRDLTTLWVFLGIAGFLALVHGRRALKLWFWEYRVRRTKGNQKARLYYRRIQRLHRLGGGPIPEDALRLANKAAFSQHTLDADEIRLLRQIRDQQACRIGIAGFWRRFWCKYVLAVI